MASTVTLTEDDYSRVSTTAAESFADQYYTALGSNRKTIASFYVPHSDIAPGRSLPLITYNGTQMSDPNALQIAFDDQMPFTFFDIHSLNVHVTNPQIAQVDLSGPGKKIKALEQNMSLLVQVSGSLRLEKRADGPLRGFSDNFVLVPNSGTAGAKGKAKSGEGRSWLIQTQNFRFVV